MKKHNKLIALCLALILMMGTCVPAFAVSLPSGITEQQVLNAEKKTETLFEVIGKNNAELADIGATVHGMLFSDETLSELFCTLYGALYENTTTLSAMGIDISLASVAENLKDFEQVYKVLNSHNSWQTFMELQPTMSWNVKDKAGFKKAVESMIKPLNELFYVMLCAGNYNVNVMLSLKGANGYESVVMPILKAMGCPDIMTQANFTAGAKKDKSNMINDILTMLFASIDNILKNPIDGICRYLPSIAYYLKNVGLSSAVSTLIAPLKVRVGIFSLSGVDKILENADMLSDASALADMMEGLDLSKLTGNDIDLKMPDIDLDGLASACKLEKDAYTVDMAQSYLTVLNWLIDMLRLNKNQLGALLGMELDEASVNVINRLLAKNNSDLMATVIDLLNTDSTTNVLDYSWSYPSYTPGTVEFTANLTRENYEKVLDEIDSTLNEFLTEFGDGSLSAMLSGEIYSSNLISQLVTALYGALYTQETKGIMELLGIDASPKGLAETVKGVSSEASAYLSTQTDWKNVKAEKLNWGITKGSRKGFEKVLLSVLSPLSTVLEFLLSEGSITVADALTLNGSNGYNTAVIPLLEGLGVPGSSIRSYATYKGANGTQNTVYYLVDPLLDLVDNIIYKPVATLCDLLPNLVYFMNSGAVNTCISNLLYPVTKLLKQLDLEDLLPDEISDLGDKLDIQSLIKELTASADLGITLATPDLDKVASLGTAVTLSSKRTYKGKTTTYTYIEADAPAVLITVLRYIVNALGSEENADVLSGLMSGDGSQEGAPDMFAMYAGNITEKLKTMSTDETIEWLYDLLFAETPTREEQSTVENIPEIIYEEKKEKSSVNVWVIVAVVVLVLLAGVLVLSKVDFEKLKQQKVRKKQDDKAVNIQKPQAGIKPRKKEKIPEKTESAPKLSVSKPTETTKPQKAQTVPAENNATVEQTSGTAKVFISNSEYIDAITRLEEGMPLIEDDKHGFKRPVKPKPVAQPEKAKPLAVDRPETQNKHKKETPFEKIAEDKEAIKLKIRQEKAMQKMIRQTKKADKYYEQALREADKKDKGE